MQISHPLEQALTGNRLPENRNVVLSVQTPARTSAKPLQQNTKQSREELLNEKAVHRIMAYMYASGATYKRIAEETNYSVDRVRVVLATEQMRALVADLIHNEFGDDIGKILAAGALESVQIVRALANDPDVADSTRLRASQDLLDRYRGKSVQYVHHSKTAVPTDPFEEIEKLEQELRTV